MIAGVGHQRCWARGGHPHWSQNMWRTVKNSEHWLVKFKICCCDWFDDKWWQRNNEHFLQISKYIVFFQDFANFKTFLRAKNRRKVADVNEGKFVFNIIYCLIYIIIALKTDTMVAYISEERQHIIWVYFY
jgi:hypothetical protein